MISFTLKNKFEEKSGIEFFSSGDLSFRDLLFSEGRIKEVLNTVKTVYSTLKV